MLLCQRDKGESLKYIFIDANNQMIRSAFANKDLRDSNGVFTGVHYGFFKALISLKKRFSDYLFVICWDGKSKRRMILSQENVEKKIIKAAYKANREKNKTDEKFIELYKQMPQLQEAITYTGIQQVHLPEFEADDVISSYCKALRDNNEIITSTTDHDYHQMLHPNVSIWDGLHLKMVTMKDFEDEFKIKPEQHVDIGALMGDDGDGIWGIPAWGEKTSLEEIQKHGTYAKVLEYYMSQYKHLENEFPSIESMLDLESLKLQKTKSGKQKYIDLYYGMPFSGVALAIEWGKIKPIPQKALMLLMYQERLEVAYSLKKVDDDISGLPEIKKGDVQIDKLQQYFEKYSIKSLSQEANVFFDKEYALPKEMEIKQEEVMEEEAMEKASLFDF